MLADYRGGRQNMSHQMSLFGDLSDYLRHKNWVLRMLDYAAWVDRAKAFLQLAVRLPGRIAVSNSIAAVENSDYHREKLAELRGSLPVEICALLSTASSHCRFWYEWTPPPKWREQLCAFYPGKETISGGARLCEQASYSIFSGRGDDESLFPQFGGMMMMNVSSPFRGGKIWIAPSTGSDERDVVLDYRGDGSGQVLLEAGVDWTKLSSSFDQFLVDWEATCYVRLTPEWLAPWRDAATGMLAPPADLAANWRSLFEEAAASNVG